MQLIYLNYYDYSARTRPPTYYTMDAATTAFLSSRIQKWDFSEFLIPDITKRINKKQVIHFL